AIAHVYGGEDSPDGVTRGLWLELAAGQPRRRFWALGVEAFRLYERAPYIVESPDEIQIGDRTIPARRRDGVRPLRILYTATPLPEISLDDVLRDPSLRSRLTGRAVFLGVTSLSAARDRVVTPYGEHMAGLEVHAQLFETLARGVFLSDVSNLNVVLLCVAIATLAACAFGLLSGWRAYAMAAILLTAAHTLPFWLFHSHVILPWFAPVATAWLAISGAATWQHFAVRRQLRSSEAA